MLSVSRTKHHKSSTGLESSGQKIKDKTTWSLEESQERQRDQKWKGLEGSEKTVLG